MAPSHRVPSGSALASRCAAEGPHPEWTINHAHFKTEYGYSLEAIDDELFVVPQSLDVFGGELVRGPACFFVVSFCGPHDGIASK